MLLPLFLYLPFSPCTLFVGFSIGLISLLSVVCSLPAAAKIVQHFLKPGACECSTACHWCCVCVCVRVLAKLLSCSAAVAACKPRLSAWQSHAICLEFDATRGTARHGTARLKEEAKFNCIFSFQSGFVFAFVFVLLWQCIGGLKKTYNNNNKNNCRGRNKREKQRERSTSNAHAPTHTHTR